MVQHKRDDMLLLQALIRVRGSPWRALVERLV